MHSSFSISIKGDQIIKTQNHIKSIANPNLLTKIHADFLFGFYLLN